MRGKCKGHGVRAKVEAQGGEFTSEGVEGSWGSGRRKVG